MKKAKVQLAEVCDFIRGVSFGAGEARNSDHDGYTPVLRGGNIQSELNFETDLVWVPDSCVSKEQKLRKGDIAICLSSGSPSVVGKTAQIQQDWDGSVGAFCGIVRTKRKELSDYIALWFRSGLFRTWRDEQARGANIQNLRFTELALVEIPFLEEPEQQRFTIELKDKLQALEKARAQSEQQSQELAALVTAGLRDSLAGGSKPMAAELVLDETSRGVGPRWREFPVIGATRAGWSPAKEPVGKQPERYKLVEPGMVFYNPMRIMIGSIAAVTRPDQIGITSPDYVVVRPKPEFLDPVWFYEWLRSPHHGGQFIAKLARGAVRERMLFTRLGKGIIPVPPLPAQEKFAALCVAARTAQEKIATLQTELEALPNALLREAFNGHS